MNNAEIAELEPFAASRLTQWGQHADALDVLSVLAQLPEVRLDKNAVFDQACNEYCAKLEQGERPDLVEFCEQFPVCKSSLFRLLDVHQFLQHNRPLVADCQLEGWPEPGQTILEFHLVRELGRGSFSRVFLATQTSVGDRLVVVKVSRKGTAEAHMLGKLGHRSIVPVHSNQTDQASGLNVICMPYLGNCTLRDFFDRCAENGAVPTMAGPLLEAIQARIPTEAAASDAEAPAAGLWKLTYVDAVLRIAIELAEALAFVHAKGIYHCDLKSSNVLLGADGQPRILDFNLSTAQSVDDGRIRGTLRYMAPEQLRALNPANADDPFPLDARTEVFAFGVILFELLTAKHPFGLDRNVLSKQALEHLRVQQERGSAPLRPLNPLVDKRFARVVESCLAQDASQRPQSGVELAAALRRCLTPAQRFQRWAARHSWKIGSAAVVLLLAAGTAATAWSQREPYTARECRLGLNCYHDGQYAEAEHHFNRALDADANLTEALFNRGRSRQRQNHFDIALADFNSANERWADGRNRACIGYCFCGLKQFATANINFRQAIEAGYAPAAVLNDLGYTYLRLGKYKDALAPLNQAVALDPTLQAAFHNRALVHLQVAGKQREEDAQAGIADIEKAIAIGPATADLLRDAACLCAKAAQHERALNYARQAIDNGLSPDLLNDPFFQILRDQPQFLELTKRPAPRTPTPIAVRLLDPVKD